MAETTHPAAALAGPDVEIDCEYGIPGLVRAWTLQTPHTVACADGDHQLSYLELELASDNVARRLLELTGGVRGAVVLRMPRGVDLIVAILGVLKAGCWYLPIALDEPSSRAIGMVRAARAVAVVGPEPFADLPWIGAAAAPPLPSADLRPLPPVAPDDPVYVLFTSGSTGTPKGVLLGNAALSNRIQWMRREYDVTSRDVFLQKTVSTFDVAGWEFFLPLVSGARCVYPAEGEHRDPARVAELVIDHGVTICHFVPSMLAEFLHTARAGECVSLRAVFCSGEALGAGLATRFHSLSGAELHNLYGPTEAAIDVTSWQVPSSLRPDDPVPIGAPIDNVRLYVLDAEQREVEPGDAGELWIGGVAVALEYVGRPELTAAAFRMIGDDRCYRTGDLVRVAGEVLEFVGRADDQVKVRGVRIELGEVEEALGALAQVGSAVALTVRPGEGPAELVAVLVPAEENRPSDEEVRDQLRERLPRAYLPTVLRWVDRVPLTRSGKADRKALAGLFEDRTGRIAGDELTGAWWSALAEPACDEPETVGFLRLGGHSLTAIRLVAWCREHLRVEVPLSALLDEDLSLAGLRRLVDTTTPVVPRAVQEGRADGGCSPLAPEQLRMWVWSRVHPGSAAYNVVTALRMTGALDLAALSAALDDVVRRHSALRARVDDTGVEPVLRYADDARLEWLVREAAAGVGDDAAAAFADEVAEVVIDTGQAPMMRAGVLRSAQDAVLVLSLHHMISDQQAVDLVLRDVADAYRALVTGHPSGQERAPDLRDHIAAAVARVGDEQWQADLAHWKATLDGCPAELGLPFRLPSPHTPAFRGRRHRRGFGANRTARIRELAKRQGDTVATTILSCVSVVLSAWTAQETIVLGMPASRRRTMAEQELVGFLVDTLPIRVDVRAEVPFAQLMSQVRRRRIDAMEHHTPSFDAVVEALRLPSSPDSSPLFQVWVNDLSEAAPLPSLPELVVEPVEPSEVPALFDLNVYLRRGDDGLVLDLVYNVDRVPGDVGEELADQFLLVLDQILGRPDVPVGELSLRTSRAPGWRSTADLGGELHVLDVAERFHAVAAATAEAPAVVLPDGEVITYQELRGQVADFAAGLSPGTVVELRSARNGRLPVALLGTWSAGAVAALVDSTLPEARRQECHEVLNPAVVVDLAGGTEHRTETGAPRALPGASHVLFTSGTSGRPAAVVVESGPLAAGLTWYLDTYRPGPGDRVALLSGLGHDPVLRDVLVPLLSGGVLVIPPLEIFATPVQVFDFVRDNGITILHATPALLELLLAGAAHTGALLPSVRLVVSGGAPLDGDLGRRLRACTDALLINAYGTTETPQIAAAHVVGSAVTGTAPIGSAVPGTDVVVLDASGRPAGVGQRGEIVVRGCHLARGYLAGSGPEERFGPDPLGVAGVRLFHTGDLGRFDPSGLVHIAGRADRQVLVNGTRVELGEIEHVALSHPGVRQAVVALRDDLLSLQVVPVAHDPVQAEELRGYLRGRLAAAAVPSAVHVVAEIATTVNHKSIVAEPVLASLPDPALRPAATVITDVLHDIAGRAVGPDENFFEAGINSIALLRVHARLRQALELELELPVLALFTHTTVRSLASYLSDGEGDGRVVPVARPAVPHLSNAARRRRQIREELYQEVWGTK
ncbi:non-ribosomal peptide synthetase [Lentzea flaviverrucosa]|uniref:Amino acid adenylation domain-containing protein n=1 Tax=Lentzea flaviverrucosa TaxID=200379 RepID=A0A1H9WVT1_9PSEU|nr:non-ribosomal peptide synthetase [Lentzea flaviverrucosa]RDI23115.1 amino acid adenylation domain-containing protein [Lentzea flaviverrucosa]SES37533.1 amino acid adenylation domain-containing protein [Lentzea flaviverrucosa]